MNKRTSRYLALVLRHRPEDLGIVLDAQGWTPVDALLSAMRRSGRPLDEEGLRVIVETNDKRRFTLSEDGRRIRAAQGHSVDVDIAVAASIPDGPLYHGTARSSLDSIFEQGLSPRGRRHVHLSADVETARRVGSRHGSPVVLLVDVPSMIAAGHGFVRADNGVWLTDRVDPVHLSFAPAGDDPSSAGPS